MKISRISRSLALVTPLASAMITDAEAAAYLKIGDIKGESTDAGFESYIKIGSFKIEIDGVAAKGNPREILFKSPQIRFPVEQASPELMLACANGRTLPSATLVLTKAPDDDGPEVVFTKIILTDVLITSYSTSAAPSGAPPMEEITLGYETIEWTYSKISKNGEITGTTTTGTITVPKE